MLGLNLPHDTRFGNIPLSQTATVSHGFIPFLARKLCLAGKSPGKISRLTLFWTIKSSCVSSRMLRNIVPHLQSAPPLMTQKVSVLIHSTPTACSFPPRSRENNTSRMWTSICAVSELLRQQPGCFIRPTFLGRTPTPPMPTRLLLLPPTAKYCKPKAEEWWNSVDLSSFYHSGFDHCLINIILRCTFCKP